MKSPWVSRALYDDKVELLKTMVRREMLDDANRQIEWLKEELTKALEKRDRIDRVEAGMTEVAHKPKPARPPMPVELKKYIESAGSVSTRRGMMSVAYKRNAEGETWEEIVADVVVPEEPREKALQAAEADDG